jgi:ABC-type transport system involved in multi-copper enzyme maturation permease subunit
MKYFAIIEDTIREGLARKTILGMFIVSTVCIVIAALIFQMSVVQQGLLSPAQGHVQTGRGAGPNLLGVTVLDFVWMIVASSLMGLVVLIGSFVTTGFVTSIMEKGTIDLLLSKPVPRWLYIVGRYSGSVLIIFCEVAYLIFGLWIVAGISLGAWDAQFLLAIPLITLAFAGIYSVIAFFAVLTRSSWFALILALALYVLASFVLPLGAWLDRLLSGATEHGTLSIIARVFHYTVPSQEMGRTLASSLLHQEVAWLPILLTVGLTAVYLGLASFAFSRKQF